jgi:cellulose synthase/poly-beta-1,6-N-acetylglucosamine synthase-like glycosyltransferase
MKRRYSPKPYQYLFIVATWIASVAWFHPRLAGLLDLADTTFSYVALLFFILFTEVAWLYAFFNVSVIVFGAIYRWRHRPAKPTGVLPENPPAVAILYTTANDFVEASAASCVRQDYPDYTVYILDDSSDPEFRAMVDEFASRHTERVRVVRRGDRRGFKAGNINNGLSTIATTEPYFALVDADEILPEDFLRRTVPTLEADESIGFVQCNHRANPESTSPLAKYMGVGIDIHWRWYQPLRNRYGFVMLLGHGAVIRRECWEATGGFPNLVSEDLAFALAARKLGWRGYFEEDVVCFEDFPETVRAFRVRHMKWTRGTCEFLQKEMREMLRSKEISIVEKCDILFPTLNLPLSLFYFIFVVDSNLVLASLFGRSHPLTVELGATSLTLPAWRLDAAFGTLNGVDFFAITLLTLLAPILCFIIDLWRRPGTLFLFLSRSTALYGALGPLSCLGVLFYLVTGKAIFHVTADRAATGAGSGATWQPAHVHAASIIPLGTLRQGLKKLLTNSHPDHFFVQGFEILCGLVFGIMCLKMVQVSFFGVAFGFILLPLMHRVSWDHPLVRPLVFIPFVLVMAGVLLGGLALAGMQSVLFGYGFHF